MSTFSQLRTQARSLETEFEGLLSTYSSFTQSISGSAMEDENRTVKSIEESLSKRDEIVSALNRVLESEASPSTAKLHQVQRHRENLADHKAEFQRIRGTILQERNHLNLLSSVRSDIESHRASTTTPSGGGTGGSRNSGMSEADYMLNERSRIDNSNSMADSLLAQAYETRDEFMRQRASLTGIQRRMFNTLSHVPGINTIIAKVNTRKKRDSLILASLITTCVLLLLLFR